jgi:hypothetical protein
VDRDIESVGWTVDFREVVTPWRNTHGGAPSLPLAICRAALLVVRESVVGDTGDAPKP